MTDFLFDADCSVTHGASGIRQGFTVFNASWSNRIGVLDVITASTEAGPDNQLGGKRMAKRKFQTTDFEGIVQTMDWVRMPDGRVYSGFKGRISVFGAKEVVEWEPTGHNSANWFCRVEGPKTSINLMGCQVRLIHEGEVSGTMDTFVVP